MNSESETFANAEDLTRLQEALLAEKTVHGFECRIRRKDGSTLRTTRTVRATLDPSGRVERYDVFLERAAAREDSDARERNPA